MAPGGRVGYVSASLSVSQGQPSSVSDGWPRRTACSFTTPFLSLGRFARVSQWFLRSTPQWYEAGLDPEVWISVSPGDRTESVVNNFIDTT